MRNFYSILRIMNPRLIFPKEYNFLHDGKINQNIFSVLANFQNEIEATIDGGT